nr:uncharacterized protein LOC113395498 [Vanessa tameamea]
MILIRNKSNRIGEEREFYDTESVSCKVNGPLALVLRISRIIGVAHLRFVPLNKAYRVSLCPYCVFHLYIYLACILLVAVIAYVHDYYVDDPKRSIRTLLGLSDLFIKFDFVLSNAVVIVTVFDMRNRMKRLIIICSKSPYEEDEASASPSEEHLLTAFALYDISDSIIYVVKDELDYGPKSNGVMSAHTMSRRLFHAYLLICNTVVEINREEGTMVLLILTNTALDIMNSLYIMASAITLSVESLLKFLSIETNTILWFIYQISNLFLWMEPCHRTQDKFQAILNTVSKLMCTPSRVKLPVLFNFYEFQIPKFRPHGICDFTRSILATILGVMATFLIIIRQFNIKDKIYSEEPLE